jgi:hypothetical protein
MRYLIACLFLCTCIPVEASAVQAVAEGYNLQERASFAAQVPCPATGDKSTACRGYVIDHVVPLCAGGEDTAKNMQWQTVYQAKKKNLRERAFCYCLQKNSGRKSSDKYACRL